MYHKSRKVAVVAVVVGVSTHGTNIATTVEGSGKTKYKFASLQRLLCLDGGDTNFIPNFGEILEILKKTCEAVAPPYSLSGNFL